MAFLSAPNGRAGSSKAVVVLACVLPQIHHFRCVCCCIPMLHSKKLPLLPLLLLLVAPVLLGLPLLPLLVSSYICFHCHCCFRDLHAAGAAAFVSSI